MTGEVSWGLVHSNEQNKSYIRLYTTPYKEGFCEFLSSELGTRCTKEEISGTESYINIIMDGIFSFDYLKRLINRYYPVPMESVRNEFSLKYDMETLSVFNLNPRPKGPNADLIITVDGTDYKVCVSFTPYTQTE